MNKQQKNAEYYEKNRDKILERAKERYKKIKGDVQPKPRGRPAGIKFPQGYKKHPVLIIDKPADEYVAEQKKIYGVVRSPPAKDIIFEADGTLSYPPADSSK